MRILPVQQTNVCGECTLCCKVLIVPELPKAKDAWCAHAVKGAGCSIYAERPESCQSFRCEWLASNLPPSLRPDKIHGVLSATSDGRNLILHEDTGWPGTAYAALRHMLDAFIASGDRYVIIVTGRQRRALGSKAVIDRLRIEIDPENPANDKVIEEIA